MARGILPHVPPDERIYVDVDDAGDFVYVRYRGGTEICVNPAEVAPLAHDCCRLFYSTAALERMNGAIERGQS